MWSRIRKDLPIKLTSLGLAILLWVAVAGQRDVVRQVRVPLLLPQLPDTLMLLHPLPETVTVTFQATGRRLFWFRLQPPRMIPAISLEATAAPVTVPLRQEFLELPRQYSGTVLDIQPPFLSIHLTDMLQKEVPVKPVLGKEPRHPYRLDETRELVSDPPRVIARGPKERVSRMPWVRTEFVLLAEAQESGTVKVALESDDPLVSFTPATVDVHFYIVEWQPD